MSASPDFNRWNLAALRDLLRTVSPQEWENVEFLSTHGLRDLWYRGPAQHQRTSPTNSPVQRVRLDYGRRLDLLRSWASESKWTEFERNHDFVQLLFPTTFASNFANADCVLNASDFDQLREDPNFVLQARSALALMWSFFGLEVVSPTEVKTVCPERFHTYFVLGGSNAHNHRRVTRMFDFLRLMGFEDQLSAFKLFIGHSTMNELPPHTLQHWHNALYRE